MICLKCGIAICDYLCRKVRETGCLAAERLSRPARELVNPLKNDFYLNFRAHKNSICASQKAHSLSIVKTIVLMLCRKIIAVFG